MSDELSEGSIEGVRRSSSLGFSCKDPTATSAPPIIANKKAENTLENIKGELLCLGIDGEGCGNVLQEQSLRQGAEKRTFEGDKV